MCSCSRAWLPVPSRSPEAMLLPGLTACLAEITQPALGPGPFEQQPWVSQETPRKATDLFAASQPSPLPAILSLHCCPTNSTVSLISSGSLCSLPHLLSRRTFPSWSLPPAHAQLSEPFSSGAQRGIPHLVSRLCPSLGLVSTQKGPPTAPAHPAQRGPEPLRPGPVWRGGQAEERSHDDVWIFLDL